MANAVTYKGGRILTEIRPMALWASITWPDSTESTWNIQGQRCLLDQFFSDIVNSKYITALSSAFSAGGHTIGAGPFLGTTGLQINPVRKGVVDDGEIQAALADAVTNNLIAWPTQDTCYFIVIPTTAIVLFQGGQSQTDFGGYHNSFQTQNGRTILYAVIAPAIESDDFLLTETASHELAEVITDPIAGTGWVGPLDAQGRLQEVCDLCFPNTTSIHGYSVSQFAVSVSGALTSCSPGFDNVPKGQNSSAAIRLDTKFERTSCLGNIIEGESALFHAEAFFRGAPTTISSVSWTVLNVQPPGAQVQTTGITDKPDFVVEVFFGVTSFELQLFVVTTLGCEVYVRRTFDVVTQAAADTQDNACALIRKLRSLIDIYHWPIVPVPGPVPGPPPPPPWDPQRDFNLHPLTLVELNGMVSVGELLIGCAEAARPFVTQREARLPGPETQAAIKQKTTGKSARLPSAHRRL